MASFSSEDTPNKHSVQVPVEEEEVDEDLEDGNAMYSLFVSEDYIAKTWSFPPYDVSQRLLCSNMSSTDHDLTGQIVWPASVLLGYFLACYRDEDTAANTTKRHSEMVGTVGNMSEGTQPAVFRDKVVLELGAGCGLAGFLCQQVAKHVHITDGNDIVIRLLERNVEFLRNEALAVSRQDHVVCNVTVGKLLWGIKSALRSYWKECQFQYADYLIGADIILWPNQIRSLLYTIRWCLFARWYNQAYDEEGHPLPSSSTCSLEEEDRFIPKAFVSYVIRAHSTTELLLQQAKVLKLQIDVIDRKRFVPEDCHVFDQLETRLFVITLSSEAIAEGCDVWNEEIPSIEEEIAHLAMPC